MSESDEDVGGMPKASAHNSWRMPDATVAITYVALMEESSIAKAAERLSCDRSTMSRRIKELKSRFSEETIDEILSAKGRYEDLGPRATELYEKFKKGLGHISQAVAENSSVFDYRSSASIYLIAANRFAINHILPRVFDETERVNAMFRYRITAMTDNLSSMQVAERLRAGRETVAITDYRISEPGIAQLEIFNDDYVVVSQPDILSTKVSVSEFVNECYRHIRTSHDPVDHALSLYGNPERMTAITGVSVVDVPELVAASSMIGVCPAFCWANSPHRAQLAANHPPINIGHYSVYMAWKDDNPNLSHLNFLKTTIHKHAARLPPGRQIMDLMNQALAARQK